MISPKKRKPRRSSGLVWPKPKLSAKAKRAADLKRAKADASENFPELNAWLDARADEVRKIQSGKRFAYHEVLAKIYEQIIGWDGDDLLEDRASTIANLQSKHRRRNLSPVNILMGAICERADRNRQLVSRWSSNLKKALDEGVNPTDIKQFLLER
jgi:hypothetical protein